LHLDLRRCCEQPAPALEQCDLTRIVVREAFALAEVPFGPVVEHLVDAVRIGVVLVDRAPAITAGLEDRKRFCHVGEEVLQAAGLEAQLQVQDDRCIMDVHPSLVDDIRLLRFTLAGCGARITGATRACLCRGALSRIGR
jgi:hypothetical protein